MKHPPLKGAYQLVGMGKVTGQDRLLKPTIMIVNKGRMKFLPFILFLVLAQNCSRDLHYSHNSIFVSITFWPQTEYAEQLKADPRLIQWTEKEFGSTGEAVLLIDANDVNELAVDAHSQVGGGCGMIEVASFPRFELRSSVDFIKPQFREDLFLEAVNDLISDVDQHSIKSTVQTLSSLGTRHHAQDEGEAVSETVKNLFQDAATGLGSNLVLSYDSLSDGSAALNTEQRTVIARMEGTLYPDETVVIGAHLDSINSSTKDQSNAPGADDDATGVSALVEMVRVLALHGAQFERSVEFHAYAAEEVGLIGSRHLANAYSDAEKSIVAMLQMDMNGYSRPSDETTIYLVTTDTSRSLRRSLKDLISSYVDADFVDQTLSAGTSDHKSWTLAGFRSVFPFENPNQYNANIHSPQDTVGNVNNFNLSQRHTQMALAFLAHQAGLVAARDSYDELLLEADDIPSNDDYKIAIFPNAKDTTALDFAIATSTDVEGVEACNIKDFDAEFCQSEMFELDTLGESNGRRFFTSSKVDLRDGDLIRITAYDAGNRAVGVREFSLSK